MPASIIHERHVFIAGAFPPPVNGFAYITQEMAKTISQYHKTVVIDLSPHTSTTGVAYHAKRLWLTLKGCFTLLSGRRVASRLLYIACEGNMGIIYTIVLCSAARMFFYPIFIHHHSFGYIEKRFLLMAMLLWVSGKAATHILLCNEMALHFSERYHTRLNTVILPNSAFVYPAPEQQIKRENAPLVIGLLSNLSDEKGLSIFLDMLRFSLSNDMNITAVLAGPPQSELESAVIMKACAEFGSRLDYRGAIYGEAKEDFYKAIDVFIFPTRYANEAQPTVIFEALAHGVPVLSYNRGCICSQTADYGAVAERSQEFVPFAIATLQRYLAAPQEFSLLCKRTYYSYLKEHSAARKRIAALFESAFHEASHA